jgi:hypothetical protein
VAILLASLQSALIWFFVLAHDNNGATPKIEFWLDDLQKVLQNKNKASVCFRIPVISPISFAISTHFISVTTSVVYVQVIIIYLLY